MSSSADGLISEIASRLIEVARLNSGRFIRMQNSVPRTLAFQSARSMAVGLWTVIGATVILSIVV